ncbi:hypothetical protein ACI65C_013533 [Semiaphis heraclei]
MFKLLEYEKSSFRCNLFSEQDITQWITEHSSTTNTNWCINTKSSNNDSSRYVCRKVYMCHHSGFNKVNSKSNKRGKSKNTECQARIDVKIKLTTKDTCKKDKYIKDGFPAIIIFINEHNHTISSAEALSFLKANNEVRLQFEKYFNDGLGLSESLSIHETKIELEFGMNSEQLANASINPKYRTIRHWYDNWKLNNLGSSTEHEKLPNNIFKVPSETNSGFYEVDVTYGCCNCSKGNLGAFCKHQAAVYHHFNTSMPNLPAITVNCRLLLAKLAFGEHVPDKLFYMPLVCESDSDKINESLNEATPGNYENNEPSCSKIPTTLTNQALEVDSNSNSEYYAEQIQELFKSNLEKYTSSTSVSILSKCLNRLKKVKSAASWESFLSTAGSNISLRHRTRATIRVQPTAINRRKPGITRGSKRLPLGRPMNTDINRKKKRKRNLGENVQKNVPNAKSHGTGH